MASEQGEGGAPRAGLPAALTGRLGQWLRYSSGDHLDLSVRIVQVLVCVALFVVALVILVRTLIIFLGEPSGYPESIVAALDGLLVVVILVDLLHTLVTSIRRALIPVRPFLVIGVLAGVRDILSASARITLSGPVSSTTFTHAAIELAVSVGAVLALVGALVLLRFAGSHPEEDEDDTPVSPHL